MSNIVSGTIQISTVNSIGLHELPPYLKAFIKKFPSVNTRVEYRRANLVYEDVLHVQQIWVLLPSHHNTKSSLLHHSPMTN